MNRAQRRQQARQDAKAKTGRPPETDDDFDLTEDQMTAVAFTHIERQAQKKNDQLFTIASGPMTDPGQRVLVYARGEMAKELMEFLDSKSRIKSVEKVEL